MISRGNYFAGVSKIDKHTTTTHDPVYDPGGDLKLCMRYNKGGALERIFAKAAYIQIRLQKTQKNISFQRKFGR